MVQVFFCNITMEIYAMSFVHMVHLVLLLLCDKWK